MEEKFVNDFTSIEMGARNRVKVTPKKSQAKTPNVNRAESAIDLEKLIRCRAHELYQRSGRDDGRETEDWLQAEAELTGERNMPLTGAAAKKNHKPRSQAPAKPRGKQVRKSKSSAQGTTEEERSGN